MSIRSLGSKRTDVMGRLAHNFSRWDRNGDGKIVHKELQDCMSDRSITGRDAATLATLYTMENEERQKNHLKNLPSFTKADLAGLEDDYFAESGRHRLDGDYSYYVKKLDGKPTELFANGLPNAMVGYQGGAPTCGFLAPLFLLAHRDPESVANMIQKLVNGNYKVQFPGEKEAVEIEPPTEAELAFYSCARDGTWMTALEKAWSRRLEEHRHPSRRKTRPFEDAVTDTQDAIQALTGNPATVVKLPKTSPSYEKGKTPRFMAAIARAIAEDAVVTANVPRGESKTPGLPDWHFFSVTSWNEDKGTVGLRNPWGGGEPVDKEGEPRDGRDDGRFEMPLREFIKSFRYVTREERS